MHFSVCGNDAADVDQNRAIEDSIFIASSGCCFFRWRWYYFQRVFVQFPDTIKLHLRSTCVTAPRVKCKHTCKLSKANEPKFGINELEQCNVYSVNTQVVCDCFHAQMHEHVCYKQITIWGASKKKNTEQQTFRRNTWSNNESKFTNDDTLGSEAGVFTVQYMQRNACRTVWDTLENKTKAIV